MPKFTHTKWHGDWIQCTKISFDISSLDIEEFFQAVIQDGLDVISVSLSEECSYLNRVSIGSFYTMKNNILTVACAGNDGPSFQTVKSVAS
jgi:hypothetical protein